MSGLAPADPADGGRSGLRNPAAAVRGLGTGTLIMETIVLLLAVQPLRMLDGGLGTAGVVAVLILAAVHLLLIGVLRRPWGWWAVLAAQGVLAACGLLHGALGVLGVLFGFVWWYLLRVRRRILG